MMKVWSCEEHPQLNCAVIRGELSVIPAASYDYSLASNDPFDDAWRRQEDQQVHPGNHHLAVKARLKAEVRLVLPLAGSPNTNGVLAGHFQSHLDNELF